MTPRVAAEEQGKAAVECLERLLDACTAAREAVARAREAVGKHRAKGGGLARLLREALDALQAAEEPCLRGCLLPPPGEGLRCSLGAAVDTLVRSLEGVSVRLERLPRLSGDTEETLARLLVDAAGAGVEAVCAAVWEAWKTLGGGG